MQTETNTLFVGRPEEFPSDISTVQKFYYLNKEEAVEIVER